MRLIYNFFRIPVAGLAVLLFTLSACSSAQAASCKSYRTCGQAVKAWCAGKHPRADGDGDGIPCENVCKSKKKVAAEKKKISCTKQ
jgi:hypothetical protein